jgi:hypothetical protein
LTVEPEARDEPTGLASEWSELRGLIDEEIERLPEHHRRLVVLCDVEGLSREEAALRLGWSLNMVRGRLERARDRLRGRLARLGLTPSGGYLALLAGSPNLSPALLAMTCRAALSFGVGRMGLGVATASVVALSEGVLKMMLLSKLKLGLAIVLSTGFVAAGTGILVAQGPGAKPEPGKAEVVPAPIVQEPAKVDVPFQPRGAGDLAKARIDAAQQRLEAQMAFYNEGRITIDRLIDASELLMRAKLDAAETKASRVEIVRSHYDVLKNILKREEEELAVGRATQADVAEAKTKLLDAEFLLARELAAPETKPAATAKAGLNPSVPANNAAESRKAEWISLFNGKDLQGWKEIPDHQGHWKVEDGVLVGKGDAGGYLFSERDDYENFHLRVEAQVNDVGDAGIFIRAEPGLSGISRSGVPFPAGIETQIRVGGPNKSERTGSLANVRLVDDRLTKPDVWFTLEIIADGGHLVTKVNDQTTVDFIDKPVGYAKGHIILQQYTPTTIVKFRKIEIKELPRPTEIAVEPQATTGFRQKEGQTRGKLVAERVEIARRMFQRAEELFRNARIDQTTYIDAWRSLLEAEEAAATTKAERIRVIQVQIKVLKNEGLAIVEARQAAARGTSVDVDRMQLMILEAEAHLIEVSDTPEGPGQGAAPDPAASATPKAPNLPPDRPASTSARARLAKERIEILRHVYDDAWKSFPGMGTSIDPLLTAAKNLSDAEFGMAKTKADQKLAAQAQIDRLKAILLASEKVGKARGIPLRLVEARLQLNDAEMLLIDIDDPGVGGITEPGTSSVPGPGSSGATKGANPSPLAKAIEAFNAESLKDEDGRNQPPLTEEEVVAAIRVWKPASGKVISKELAATLESISEGKRWPEGSNLAGLTQKFNGKPFLFRGWWVILQVPGMEDQQSIMIRERLLRSVTYEEALTKAEAILKATASPQERSRLEKEIASLKEMILKRDSQPK